MLPQQKEKNESLLYIEWSCTHALQSNFNFYVCKWVDWAYVAMYYANSPLSCQAVEEKDHNP